MEFQLLTDMNTGIQAIDFNYEAIKADLSQKLEQYQGLVVTEDGIKEAKKDRAALNNLKKALDEKRIATKKQYLAPFDAFESKVKELISLVDKPVVAIDTQIKEYERRENEKKTAEITQFFDASVGGLKELVSFAQLWNPRWLNDSYKMGEIKAEITAAVCQINDNVQIIKAMGLTYEQEVLNVLFSTLDLTQALKKKAVLEEQQARMEAIKAAQEAAKPVETVGVVGAFKSVPVFVAEPAVPRPSASSLAPVAPVQEKEHALLLSIRYRESQRSAINRLLSDLSINGIKFEIAE